MSREGASLNTQTETLGLFGRSSSIDSIDMRRNKNSGAVYTPHEIYGTFAHQMPVFNDESTNIPLYGRRRSSSRCSTLTLKRWLYEHYRNPYPTKNEKVMLAMMTRMTLTQVSTWFANARRRLKKESTGKEIALAKGYTDRKKKIKLEKAENLSRKIVNSDNIWSIDSMLH
ncbi:hypothetical protein ACOME3_000390 [Neoechinorhynchus agilis]